MDAPGESVSRLPTAALRPFLGSYVGYRMQGMPSGTHRGLPSPYLTVILTLDDPLVMAAHPDPTQAPGRYDTLVGGLHTTPAVISQESRQAGIQLSLSPLGARMLLGVPAGALSGMDLDGVELLGPTAKELHGRLQTAGSWAQRFTLVDELLLRHADVHSAVPAEVAQAWQLLLDTGGSMAVSELAAAVGWSTRHLSQRFNREIGLTPKAAGRVMRFDAARRRLQQAAVSPRRPTLADLAVSCGYYDQAHLAREFRELAGCAPSQWVAEEFRNIQVMAAAWWRE